MVDTCKFDNCNKKITARMMCRNHYYQARRNGEFGSAYCYEKKCEKIAVTKGYCNNHYTQKMRSGELTSKKCQGPNCDRGATNNGLCGRHDLQYKNRGKLTTIREFGQWGNWYKTKYGYIVRSKRVNGKKITQRQHRLIMEEHIGRELFPGEEVHHINGIRDDNRIENLELWSTRQPKGQRIEDKTAWAKEWLSIYEPQALA